MNPPADNAEAYEKAVSAPAGRIRETPPARWKEWEVQARLYAGDFGVRWELEGGGGVEVLRFGEWNHEAGPDFKSARVRFSDGDERTGDIEVDMEAEDWERHGHARNPNFNTVILHLFVRRSSRRAFARSPEHGEIPQACLAPSVPLPESPKIEAHPAEDKVQADDVIRMAGIAAEYRLRRKRAAFLRASGLHGEETALFHAVARGMGYRNNSTPFLLVAQRAGVAASESILFGLAGFLRAETFDKGDEQTRAYLRGLWDGWWPHRDRLTVLTLRADAWNFSGLRPANHPHRRMGALALTAARFPRLISRIRSEGLGGFSRFFETLEHPYWSRHWNLSASALDREFALVGGDRILDLAINAFLPTLPLPEAWDVLRQMEGPAPNGRVLRSAEWLAGSSAGLPLRRAVCQQGLLQLYADFGSRSPREVAGLIAFSPSL